MRSKLKLYRFLALATALCALNVHGAELKLLFVKKIWDGANHNAFTDLIRFNNQWFCTCREAEGHVNGNGRIRVITSADGETWKSAALLEEDGIDLRDPKLSITPDNRLMLTLGGSVYKDKKLVERQSRVSFSKDGSKWTPPQRVLSKGDWLWRVTWHEGRAYGMDYGAHPKSAWDLHIVTSKDGKKFELLQDLAITNQPNEATIRFLANNDAMILTRREGEPKGKGDRNAWIGIAHPPYHDWTWKDAGMFVGGPNFIVLPDGKLIAGGRVIKDKKAQTFVGTMTTSTVTPDVILPSGGDCSYPGLVWHENVLWVSYYSSHEGKTSVYLAKVAVNK